MSLTDEDLSLVREVVIGAIESLVIPRFDEQDKRFDALEADMRAAKEDVKVLKEGVRALKEDVYVLKVEMRKVKESLSSLEGRIEALEADVRALYLIVAAQKPSYTDKKFAKLSVEQKVLKMYEDVKLLAREAGVTLPN